MTVQIWAWAIPPKHPLPSRDEPSEPQELGQVWGNLSTFLSPEYYPSCSENAAGFISSSRRICMCANSPVAQVEGVLVLGCSDRPWHVIASICKIQTSSTMALINTLFSHLAFTTSSPISLFYCILNFVIIIFHVTVLQVEGFPLLVPSLLIFPHVITVV